MPLLFVWKLMNVFWGSRVFILRSLLGIRKMQPTRLWEWTEEHAADEDEEENQSWKAKIHTAKDAQLVLVATVQPLIVSNNDLSQFTLATDTIHVLCGLFNDI